MKYLFLFLRFYKIILKLIFCFLFSLLARAEETKLSPAFFISQAGSGGASLREDMSYLLNPALLAFQTKSKGAIAYSFKQKEKTLMASVLDIKSKLPMALTYQRSWTHSFKKSRGDNLFIHSGLRISPSLSLGFSLNRELKFSDWNFNLAGAFRLSPNLAFALFLDKVLEEEKKNQRILSLAFYHRWKSFFSTQVDFSRTEKSVWILKGGMRSLFHPLFSLQLGARAYFKDKSLFKEIEKSFLSGGLSFHSPKFLLEYGVEADKKIYQHSVALLLRI